MAEIILVPTSHVARQSLDKVREVIEKEKPDLVAVELDINRYMAARQESRASLTETLKALGVMTFVFYWALKKLQSWLGKKLGILPGSEMLHAVEIANKKGIKFAFIDRDIGITMMRIRNISWREKMKLLLYLFKGFTIDYVLLKARKKKGIDLSKVPPKELIREAMSMLKKEFPQLYNVLVHERDIYMVKKLKQLSQHYEKIVAVTGAGHTDGMKKLLRN